MAPITPVGVPSQLIAGDTLLFRVSYGDFPVSEGWTLSMTLAGVGTLQSEAGEITNDGSVTWTVTIPASRTRTLAAKAGVYRWFHYMTGSGSYAGRRYTVAEGRIEVVQNPADAADGDFQYQEEKDLAVVEAKLAGRLADDLQMYMIRGRQVSLIPYKDLVAERARLKRAVYRLRTGHAMPSVRVTLHA